MVKGDGRETSRNLPFYIWFNLECFIYPKSKLNPKYF